MTSVSGLNNGSPHTSQSDLARGLPLMPPEQQASDSLPDLDRSPVLQPPETDVPVLNVPSNSHQVLEGAPVGQRADRGLRSRVYERSPSASARSISATPSSEQYEEARQVILSSFAPRVACFASRDTEDFVALKGFKDGLCGLLRAFGEHIQGKVVIRDSVGASKGWEDFGIRFINPSSLQYPHRLDSSIQLGNSLQSADPQQSSQSDDIATAIDQILDYHFGSEKELLDSTRRSIIHSDYTTKKSSHFKQSVYLLYLRKLLSTMPIVPHETFSHPVACIIAVSSHNSAPIDSLHQLYEDSCHGEGNIPAWINTKDYLRYYVLIHDEENDDITKSTALFDQMKRHFGLHCHLLRLQSSQSVQTDDDSVQVPRCEWLSAEEELDLIREKDHLDDVESDEVYIHESDATSIKIFLREMVTQSVIPSMEGRVTAWNDKVGSRRRGISGRFMSLSKRFAGFGSSKPTAAGQDSSNTSGGNYDSARGLYSVDTTEAILRQLADYAFMLRDWRLAYSTYEILRTDFGNDKAWKYYAAANEMSAISLLLNPQSTSSRTRSETLDQMLESASYSYLTRCSMPLGVIRCLTIAVELLKCRGSAAVEDATRWGSKLLELNVLSSTAQAFLSERIAECYQSRIRGSGLMQACTRKRKSAFWSLLASTTWIEHGKLFQAQEPFRLAGSFYRQSGPRGVSMPFPSMEPFWDSIEHVVPDANRTLSPEFDEGSPRIGEEELFSNAESEVLDGYQPSGQNNPSGVGETNSMYNTRQADLFGFSQDK